MTPEELLDLMDKSAQLQRADIRATGENHFDLSERLLADLSAARTIADASKVLEVVATTADPLP